VYVCVREKVRDREKRTVCACVKPRDGRGRWVFGYRVGPRDGRGRWVFGYRVAKIHEMSYLYRSFSAKEPYN